jgi:membrane protease YdiL (CAAX protease family)
MAFAHCPLDTGFSVAPAQVPLYIFNVVIAGGIILGFMRLISGSVIVASVSHGVWNGVGYTLFGSRSTLGALGIQDTAIYGPEAGIVGVVLNVVFATGLWLMYRRTAKQATAKYDERPNLIILLVITGLFFALPPAPRNLRRGGNLR